MKLYYLEPTLLDQDYPALDGLDCRIKRVQRLGGGAYYLISDNEHYESEMEILGRCEVRIGKTF